MAILRAAPHDSEGGEATEKGRSSLPTNSVAPGASAHEDAGAPGRAAHPEENCVDSECPEHGTMRSAPPEPTTILLANGAVPQQAIHWVPIGEGGRGSVTPAIPAEPAVQNTPPRAGEEVDFAGVVERAVGMVCVDGSTGQAAVIAILAAHRAALRAQHGGREPTCTPEERAFLDDMYGRIEGWAAKDVLSDEWAFSPFRLHHAPDVPASLIIHGAATDGREDG